MHKRDISVEMVWGSMDMESLIRDMYKYQQNRRKIDRLISQVDKTTLEQRDLLERFEGLLPQFSTNAKK